MKFVKAKPRNFGMDLARVIATMGVLWAHATVYKIGELEPPPYTAREIIAVLCVMVFFALSGYLYGASYFRDDRPFSEGRFFLNRILRILPAYYLALIWTWNMIGREVAIPKSCFFLLQNYDATELGFMPVSWSLCVEEWTYILLGVLLLFLRFSKKLTKEKKMLIGAGLLILVSTVLRVVVVLRDPTVAYDAGIRKQTLLSMDVFGYGILVAWLEKKKPEQYRRLLHSVPVFVALAGLSALTVFGMTRMIGGSDAAIVKILGFTVLNLCVLYVCLQCKDCPLFRKKPFEKAAVPMGFASKLTYPLYLIHFQYYTRWSDFCRYQGIVERKEYIIRAILTALLWALVVHLVLEIPVEFLRKRLVKKHEV